MALRVVIIAAVALLWVAGGCSGAATPGGGSSNGSSADPLAGAPSDWLEFIRWAEQKLTQTPAPVALPERAVAAKPRWPVIRLDAPQLLERAAKNIDWAPAAHNDAPLAEVSGVRSDVSGPNHRAGIDKKGAADGGEAVRLRLGGFRVKREEVGLIDLRLRLPFGRHFTLAWGKAGQILIPVRSTTEAFTILIPTDGFAEWEGVLNAIDLVSDGVEKKPIEVEWLRFRPRANAYPEAAATARVRLALDTRDAVYLHCPGELRYPKLQLPPAGALQFGLGALASGKGAEQGAVVECTIEVVEGGKTTPVFEGRADGPGWSEQRVSLAAWSGKSVEIVLRAKATQLDAIAFFSAPTLYEPQEHAPLVVLYLIDTLAADHMELYGYARNTMPRLTEMARAGVWFEAVANASRTIESIPNLMLSLPVERHGVWQNSTLAPRELKLLAESIREAGFATISFCTNVNAGPRQGMDQGFDHFVDRIGYYWTSTDRTLPLDEAMKWVRQHRDRPMFMYVHTAEPHAPYTPPADLEKRYDADYAGRFDGTYDGASGFHNIRPSQSRDIQHIAALYDAEVTYADRRLGLFLDALKEEGLLERSTFWVTSDHGEEFLEHGVWEHGLNLHNHQTRIPLIAFGAGVAATGKAQMVAQLHDVAPTLLDMLEIKPAHAMVGASLWPFARSGAAAGRPPAELMSRQLYLANHNYRVPFGVIEYGVLEPGQWKLLHSFTAAAMLPGGAESRFRLYNVGQDAAEKTNLIANEQAQARRLIEDLLRWRAAQRPYDVRAGSVEFDAFQSESLKALGYIGGAAPGELEPEEPPEINSDPDPAPPPKPD